MREGTTAEAAHVCGVSVRTLRRYELRARSATPGLSRHLPVPRRVPDVGRRVRLVWDLDALEEWMTTRKFRGKHT